ncbi:B12-binding domain/radical SAM domain-containing protein [Pseudomonas sp.]|uniref:B12-binding domain/radical SAM domain-containing protein n=1 Tax=Pseudomonas sp. TaxID=306 RepID=UPI0028A22640|nr:B12-binding domain/radical SAM domain-containing protein [Pseudomonas sp.]
MPLQSSELNPAVRGSRKSTSGDFSRQIRAIAISAPECLSGTKSGRALNSSDPVSLFNACRCAADLARGRENGWAMSNWATDRRNLREKFLLMYSLDEMEKLKDLLLSERANILLIGAMTICMPGAIECAKAAKALLGDEILIILGGRHINETMYLKNESNRLSSFVRHHAASPSRLIRDRAIPPLFDVIIAGEAEKVIAEIGELFSRSDHCPLSYIKKHLNTNTAGKWIADFPRECTTLVSKGIALKRDALPSVVKTFGVTASFNVFNKRMTSHLFSDTGPGCIYDCDFCSERRLITGGIQEIESAPHRLYRQLQETVDIIKGDYPNRLASAFIEDSTFLSGSPAAITKLCQMLESHPIDIIFGGQFTIDQILRKKELIQRLALSGMRYIFIGLETLDPSEIGGMNKDTQRLKQSWKDRFLEALDFMASNTIDCGCALLFGLGECHSSRKELLRELIALKSIQGQPVAISANWAVQHPLRDCHESQNEDYLRWATPQGDLLNLFHRFGEASVEYPLANVAPPQLDEVRELVALLDEFEAADGGNKWIK